MYSTVFYNIRHYYTQWLY